MLKSRKILSTIKKWLPEKEFIILNGARQVGKTSLLKLIKKELLESGVSENQIFYLNLEELKLLEPLNQDPENLLSYITKFNETNYFLIDEIQYLDNPSNFLKHLFDKYAPKIKIITTGSSSLELKAKLQDSLVGRKVSFMINPLNFEEFLNFKEVGFLPYLKTKKLPQEINDKFKTELFEYLIYGGMPAVTLQKNKNLKQKLLEEYVSTYINKDIRTIGKVNNISQFNNLIKVLASQIGNLLNVSELSNTVRFHRSKIIKYLDLLEHTFVLSRLIPFHQNIRSQVTKMPKLYFFDLGIRNAVLGNFLPLSSRQDSGALFENFVFLELKKKKNRNLSFYRTLSGSEIDFILEKNNFLELVEVKFKNLKHFIDSRILRNFTEKEKKRVNKISVVSLNCLKKESFESNNKKELEIDYTDFRDL